MSKNTEGWIRHRGGKCPVKAGTLVDVRYRSGIVNEHVKSLESVNSGGSVGLSAVTWEHYGSINDIMAYRLHKPAEQPKPFIEAVQEFSALAKVPQLDGPIGWRDRIAEIDVEVQARTVERAELVQKLASEGFALIGRVVEPVEDVSCRNIKAGDTVVFVKESNGDFTNGRKYNVLSVDSSFAPYNVIDDEGDENCLSVEECAFHSRPSA